MRSFFLCLAVCAGLFLLVPLMVWGGTGSWRHALYALRQYLLIVGTIAALGGGVGLLMAWA